MASLISLYLNVIIFYNTAMSKPTKYSIISPSISTSISTSTSTSRSTPKSINTEKDYKKIFLFMNNLNFVTNNYEIFKPYYILKEEVYDGENGLVLDEIKKSLKRANGVGITDFLIPECNIDVNKFATYQILEALVKLSFSYNITINILLDQQFLISPKSKKFMSNSIFGYDSPKTILSKHYGLVLDPSNPRIKFLIEDRIKKFSKCKIQNFYFGQNPYYSISRNTNLNKSEIVDFFDENLFHERTQFILKISDKIKLFYFYEFLHEKNYENRFRSNIKGLKYEGSIVCSVWNPFSMAIIHETFLTFIFQKSETEKKVIMFYFEIIEESVEYINVVLGIYLFSPLPIVLVIQTKYAFPLYNNILTNQPILPNDMYAKVNSAYIWVLKIMKENPFFQKTPSLLEDVKLEDDVISAISGTEENGKISGLLFLLYNRKSRNFNIDLNQYFPGWSFKTYSILYDSVPQEKSCLLNQSGEIDLLRQQILIIQPNLLF